MVPGREQNKSSVFMADCRKMNDLPIVLADSWLLLYINIKYSAPPPPALMTASSHPRSSQLGQVFLPGDPKFLSLLGY